MSQNLLIRQGAKALNSPGKELLRKASRKAFDSLTNKAKYYSSSADTVIEEVASDALGHLKHAGKSKSAPANLGSPMKESPMKESPIKISPRSNSKDKPDPVRSDYETNFIGFEAEGRAYSVTPNASPKSPSKTPEMKPVYNRAGLKNVKKKLFAESADVEKPALEELSYGASIAHNSCRISQGPGYQIAEKMGYPPAGHIFGQARGMSTLTVLPFEISRAMNPVKPTSIKLPASFALEISAKEFLSGLYVKSGIAGAEPAYKLINAVKWLRLKAGEMPETLKSFDAALNFQSKIHPTIMQQILSGPADFIMNNGSMETISGIINLIKFAGISGFGLFAVVHAEGLNPSEDLSLTVKYSGELASSFDSVAINGGPKNGGNSPQPFDGTQIAASRGDNDNHERKSVTYSVKEKAAFAIMMVVSGPVELFREIFGFDKNYESHEESSNNEVNTIGDIEVPLLLAAI